MIAELFTQVSNAITAFVSCLGDALEGVVSIFWIEGTSGAAGHFSTVGILLLISAGVGLVYFGYRTVRNLVARA